MMNRSALFTEAHKIAREIRAHFNSYRAAFSAALCELYGNGGNSGKESKWHTVADWFQAKASMAGYAFSDEQIVGSTEKALKIRTAVHWRNGISVCKEIWIPRSVVSDADEAALGYGSKPFEHAMIVQSIRDGRDCFEFSREYAKWCASCVA